MTDSKEYKDLERELLAIKNELVKSTAELQVTKAEKADQLGTINELNQKVYLLPKGHVKMIGHSTKLVH